MIQARWDIRKILPSIGLLGNTKSSIIFTPDFNLWEINHWAQCLLNSVKQVSRGTGNSLGKTNYWDPTHLFSFGCSLIGHDDVVRRRRVVDGKSRVDGHGSAVRRRRPDDLDAVVDVVRDAVARVDATERREIDVEVLKGDRRMAATSTSRLRLTLAERVPPRPASLGLEPADRQRDKQQQDQEGDDATLRPKVFDEQLKLIFFHLQARMGSGRNLETSILIFGNKVTPFNLRQTLILRTSNYPNILWKLFTHFFLKMRYT